MSESDEEESDSETESEEESNSEMDEDEDDDEEDKDGDYDDDDRCVLCVCNFLIQDWLGGCLNYSFFFKLFSARLKTTCESSPLYCVLLVCYDLLLNFSVCF